MDQMVRRIVFYPGFQNITLSIKELQPARKVSLDCHQPTKKAQDLASRHIVGKLSVKSRGLSLGWSVFSAGGLIEHEVPMVLCEQLLDAPPSPCHT